MEQLPWKVSRKLRKGDLLSAFHGAKVCPPTISDLCRVLAKLTLSIVNLWQRLRRIRLLAPVAEELVECMENLAGRILRDLQGKLV